MPALPCYAALEERILAYRMSGKGVSPCDEYEYKSLTAILQRRPRRAVRSAIRRKQRALSRSRRGKEPREEEEGTRAGP